MIGGMAEEPEVVAGRIMALCRGAAESMLQFDGRR